MESPRFPHHKPDFEAFQQLQLFEYKRFLEHHFLLPDVVEITPVREPITGHDDFGFKTPAELEQWETEELRRRLFNL